VISRRDEFNFGRLKRATCRDRIKQSIGLVDVHHGLFIRIDTLPTVEMIEHASML
jgi:hypothetical protein